MVARINGLFSRMWISPSLTLTARMMTPGWQPEWHHSVSSPLCSSSTCMLPGGVRWRGGLKWHGWRHALQGGGAVTDQGCRAGLTDGQAWTSGLRESESQVHRSGSESMSTLRNVREVICSWFSCLMTIGFGDISQNRVLDELVRDTASCGLAHAFFFAFCHLR